MKKLLLLSFAICAFSAFVQSQTRTIDWATTEILHPDTLYSTSAGTPINLEMVFKNNGADTAFVGDSVLYQFIIAAGNTPILSYPSASSFAVRILKKNMNPGDTMHVAIVLSTTAIVTTSVNISLVAISDIINRPNLAFETASTNTNNGIQKTVTWFNVQKFGVGVNEVADINATSVYPNPANDVLNIASNNVSLSNMQVYDVTGKLVLQQAIDANASKVDVSSLPIGVYVYQLLNTEGQLVKTSRFTISR